VEKNCLKTNERHHENAFYGFMKRARDEIVSVSISIVSPSHIFNIMRRHLMIIMSLFTFSILSFLFKNQRMDVDDDGKSSGN
jgi:hypothetical protein